MVFFFPRAHKNIWTLLYKNRPSLTLGPLLVITQSPFSRPYSLIPSNRVDCSPNFLTYTHFSHIGTHTLLRLLSLQLPVVLLEALSKDTYQCLHFVCLLCRMPHCESLLVYWNGVFPWLWGYCAILMLLSMISSFGSAGSSGSLNGGVPQSPVLNALFLCGGAYPLQWSWSCWIIHST